MYNQYIGNTGKYSRVDDSPPAVPYPPRRVPRPEASPPGPVHAREPDISSEQNVPFSPEAKSKPPLFGFLGGGSGGLNSLFDHLPFGLDTGDILLFLLLLFFFMESHDEEFLIILGFMVFSLVKDH